MKSRNHVRPPASPPIDIAIPSVSIPPYFDALKFFPNCGFPKFFSRCVWRFKNFEQSSGVKNSGTGKSSGIYTEGIAISMGGEAGGITWFLDFILFP